MKLLIGADIVPTQSNQSIFESGIMGEIVDAGLLKIFEQADYRIFNLECPLTDKHNPIEKCGPNLIASTASINGIKTLGVDFVTIANNHIKDQGDQGLYSTIKVLQEANIAFAGVGDNLQEAWKPFIVTLGNKRVGIYCCAEHEFPIAEKDKPGANPFDPLNSPDHISELRDKCDYLICLYHGGKEHYRYPAPYLQKVCRKIVDKGADLVICQQSHCVGCVEKYKGETIVYGQGNALFDFGNDNEFWQTSLLLSIDLDTRDVAYIPLRKVGNGTSLALGADAKKILEDFHKRSDEILQDGFIDAEYSKFAKSMLACYVVANSRFYDSTLFRGMNKLSGNRLRTWLCDRKTNRFWAQMLNGYECEAHRELIIRGLLSAK